MTDFETLLTESRSNVPQRLPFTDVKHAALHLMESLASRPWALPALCETPGMLDQLLNAEAAASEEPLDRQWRYSVLRAVMACEVSTGLEVYYARDPPITG